ncbi:MAG: sialidase family protein [Rhodocyclaceae bacterium]|nr:sialidase family protein [Rhodocyclaceae bacterium]
MAIFHGLGTAVALVIVVSALPGSAFAAGTTDKTAMPGMGGMAKKARVELASSAAFAENGQLLAVAKQGDHLLLYRSDDQGTRWSSPVIVNALPEAISGDGENRPKILFTQDGGVLVSWTKPLAKPNTGEVRLARSNDGGASFATPITVHRDRQEITHRFESMTVGGDGRVYVAWIDKRDLESARATKKPYRGAAIYAAVSDDGGRSFKPEVKIADHSCECCRIAAAVDSDGAPLILWRHVFEPNERDHALAKLGAGGTPITVERATFDRWKVDGCPHHGPALAVAPDGTRHAVWFNQKDGEGRVFHGRLTQNSIDGQRPVGGERAAHADLVVAGRQVAIVWKEFDGERTQLRAEISGDGGNSFRQLELGAANGASDHPRAIKRGNDLFAYWRTEREGMRVFRLQ